LVLFWADAGWTAGDPSATPRAAFAKAVSALQRAVGTAWEIQAVASLPRALGGLGVGILNAADDLAGGGAALTRGARQAAWKVAQQGNASESLPAHIRNSFRSVSYVEIKEPLIVYRLYGGEASQLGRWFMLQRPQGRLRATIDYGIRPEWGNTLERLVALRLPRGTRVFVGPAAPQGGLVGGGLQVFVPDEIQIRPEWVLFDVAFP
jgi:hypothetical protein